MFHVDYNPEKGRLQPQIMLKFCVPDLILLELLIVR